MRDEIILKQLIARLEERGITGFESFPVSEDQEKGRAAAGTLHLAEAIISARQALASGDAGEMQVAAKIYPAFERTGLELAGRAIKAKRRRAAGKTRGRQQADLSKLAWKPWVAMFVNLVSKGTEPKKARRLIKTDMAKKEFVIPATGLFPSDKTIRKRLAVQKK
jgi:hypothetical protein